MAECRSHFLRMALPALIVAAAASAYTPDRGEVTDFSDADSTTLYAPHRGADGRFFVPWSEDPKTTWGIIKWWLFDNNPYDKSGEPNVPVVANTGHSLAGSAGSSEITWVGHSTFAVHDGDDVLLTDPHFTKRALIPSRAVEPGIPLSSIPDDAFAVISHNHYDHLDADTVAQLPASVQWFVPLGMAEWFRERDRPRVVELDWWESVEYGRWKITCLPSQHWSRRIEQGTNEALWCSWMLDSGDYRYYFAGDTGYFHGFLEFEKRFGQIDVAMLPIGAYEPRWFMRYQHMNPAESYQAFLDLNARFMLSMHWGTFDLTDEPIDFAPKELERVLASKGGDERVVTLAVGESWRVPERKSKSR